MPKAQATALAALYRETVKAEQSHAQLMAQVDKLAALQAKLADALTKRSASIDDALTRLGTDKTVSAGIAKVRAIEKASTTTLLKLQMQMQRENQVFTAVSNVLKTRHDTIKNSIGNIR